MYTKLYGVGDAPGRECVICETVFQPRRQVDRTCSLDCSIRWRRKLARDRAAKRYQPRPLRPDAECEGCKASIPAPKSGPMPRWCSPCRAGKEDERARKRFAVRRCHKCQKPVPDAERKPGKTVCLDCRVDPRISRDAHEFRRRLRRYGIDQDRYDQLLRDQGERCPGCNTDDPGPKGWCIDHCHRTGRVRALLCNRCNTVLGLANEDPTVLQSLAAFAERIKADQAEDKDIV